ncbi:hypothetical protein GQ53DRAFT_663250 [Thozetella sp. PMI_491]|nr:hypothetical protein GQ53DRAFT_663250 [Thozetella sp. PMI_491]
MVTYVKRHTNFTRAEFLDYWQTKHAPKVAPLAVYFNITRYQQIQVGGMVLPTAAGSTTPNSTVPVEFDGIAMFLYKSADVLTAMLSHPYYLEVIAPDEAVFIDKSAFGNGMVATWIGTNIEVTENGLDVWEGNSTYGGYYQRLFNSYL